MAAKILTISLVLLASCCQNDLADATKVVQNGPMSKPASHPTPIPPITLPAHHPVADLAKHIGQRVTMQGTLAAIPWQHMLSPPAGTQHHYYFNVGARQIVLYSKDELACKTTLEVTGTVLELAGAAQRGSPDGLKEYHLDVASWRCLP